MCGKLLAPAILCLAGCAATALAGTIASASFTGFALVVAPRGPSFVSDNQGNIVGYVYDYNDPQKADLSSPGSAMIDAMASSVGWNCNVNACANYGISQGIAQVTLTNGLIPVIDLTGSVINAAGQSDGRITYYWQVQKLNDDAPDINVPIEVSVTASMNTAQWSSTSVDVYYKDTLNPNWTTIFDEHLGEGIGHYEGGYSTSTLLLPGEWAAAQMWARGSANGTGPALGSGTQEYQAILDPAVQIDPTWSVSYHGQQVLGTDLYSLGFSPELGNSDASVPEPSSLLLTGLNLVLVGLWLRFRRRCKPGPAPACH
jgi:hypothetical protein